VPDVLAHVDEVIHPGVPEERRPASRQMILGMLGSKSEAEQQAFAASQAGIAIGFLVLAAQALGYATSVMGGFEPDKVREILGLPAHVNLPAIIALGVADEPGFSTHRQPLSRIVRHIGPDA
jgi:nitroreductase